MKTGLIEAERLPHTYMEIDLRYKMLQDNTQIGVFEYELAKTRTLFEDSICILSNSRIEKGSLVKIELPMGDRLLKTFCDVDWCNWDDEVNQYESKLTFITMREEDILALGEFIKKNS